VRGPGPSGLTSSVRARVSVVNPESDHVIQFSSKNSAGSISAAGETNQAYDSIALALSKTLARSLQRESRAFTSPPPPQLMDLPPSSYFPSLPADLSETATDRLQSRTISSIPPVCQRLSA
jgi:hypothetical protein